MLICPKCGRNSQEVEFIESFCNDCYPVNIKCPKKMELKFCKICDRMFLKGEWIPFNESRIALHVISKCKGEFEEGTYDLKEKEAVFKIRKDDAELTVSKHIPFEMILATCQNCSRLSGGYFEALVQLRGKTSAVERYKRLFEKKLSRKTFISREKEQKNGWDLYVGDSKVVLNLVSELGLDAKITTTLAGVKENGKKAYRTTFAIRL